MRRIAIAALSVFLTGLYVSAFAQENITITTYYPSPYGSYNQLAANTLTSGVLTVTNNTYLATVAASNVGIGTSTPNGKLQVRGSDGSANGNAAGIELSNFAGGGGNWYLRAGATGTNTPAGGFSLANDALYAFYVTSTGNFGIGAQAPGAPLVVKGTTGAAVTSGNSVEISGSDVSGNAKIELRTNGGTPYIDFSDDNASDFDERIIKESTGLDIVTSAANPGLFIKETDGNVGIGSNAPDAKFLVNIPNGTAWSLAEHVYNGNSVGNNGTLIEAGNASNNDYFLKGNSPPGAGSQRFVLTQAGYLRIGGSGNPSSQFEVVGLPADGAQTNYVTTRLVGGAYKFIFGPAIASSRRFKDKIEPFKDDFYNILKAQPKSFVYKNTGEADIGYIAEEFEGIGLKKLVTYNEGQPQSIKYDKIPLYLVEIVKDQQKELESLKKEIAELKAKIK